MEVQLGSSPFESQDGGAIYPLKVLGNLNKLVSVAHRAELALGLGLRRAMRLWTKNCEKLFEYIEAEIVSLDRLLPDDNGRFGSVFRSDNQLANLRTKLKARVRTAPVTTDGVRKRS